jgi:YfiH family protein
LIADPVQRISGAIHAGWRGTVDRISSNVIDTLSHTFGSRISGLIAVIGPGIGECCFEVGPEVATQFEKLFPERNDLQGRTRINLAEANRRQLEEAGIPADRITVVDQCTCCGAEEFHSYRRDRDASGRMVSAIGIRT